MTSSRRPPEHQKNQHEFDVENTPACTVPAFSPQTALPSFYLKWTHWHRGPHVIRGALTNHAGLPKIPHPLETGLSEGEVGEPGEANLKKNLRRDRENPALIKRRGKNLLEGFERGHDGLQPQNCRPSQSALSSSPRLSKVRLRLWKPASRTCMHF